VNPWIEVDGGVSPENAHRVSTFAGCSKSLAAAQLTVGTSQDQEITWCPEMCASHACGKKGTAAAACVGFSGKQYHDTCA
jgi:hypothetical protein